MDSLSPFGPPRWATLTPSTNRTPKKLCVEIPLPQSPTQNPNLDERLACHNPIKRAKELTIRDGVVVKVRLIGKSLGHSPEVKEDISEEAAACAKWWASIAEMQRQWKAKTASSF